jgi:hypothetical protein
MLQTLRYTLILAIAALAAQPTQKSLAQTSVEKEVGVGWHKFAGMESWDDGLSEMCYYDAEESIYGKKRDFTRVHLVNRQWMDRISGVKADETGDDVVPVLKFNIAEEIPTENYNYRYLTTLFLRRDASEPFKMVTSSQEWCGTTFKHLRWGSSRMELKCFSYFGGEGDGTFGLERDVFPHESLPLLARGLVAGGTERTLKVLVPMRGTHLAQPTVSETHLSIEPLGPNQSIKTLKTKAGKFNIRRVIANSGESDAAWFDIEAEAPYRLIAFSSGGVSGVLKHFEKRPYWDRSSASNFHPVGKAP